MPLSGFLYRPVKKERDERPSPTLLYFHGGPRGPDATRLPVPVRSPSSTPGSPSSPPNVRGSSGYGRLFSHADDRYGRYAGIDDAADCAEFLCRQGIADPDSVFCSGRSYGGYLTLACLTFHPRPVRGGGIAICGMSDLESFFRNTEPWIAVAAYTKYGHPDSDRELLADLSPIHRIDDMRAPLLVVHGAHDTNVPVSESQQIVAELQARGAIAEMLMFDDEGHEIVKRSNQHRLTEAVAEWIAKYPTRPGVMR